MKVLVIEDHPTDLKLMGAVLRIDGHAVDARTAAEEAMEAIAAGAPDVILLDLRLPGMDGPMLVRELKTNPETRHIPIVAMTAYPEQYRREDLIAAGCEAYIVKPVDTRELATRLEMAAGARGQS